MKKTAKTKFLAAAVAVMVGISFMPVMGSVYAQEDESVMPADIPGTEEEVTEVPEITQPDQAEPEATQPQEEEKEEAQEPEGEKEEALPQEEKKEEPAPVKEKQEAAVSDEEKAAVEEPVMDLEEDATVGNVSFGEKISCSYNIRTNKVTISGTIKAPYKFGAVVVDNTSSVVRSGMSYSNGGRTIKGTINMGNYSVGYHVIAIFILDKDGNAVNFWYKDYIPSNVYVKPANAPAYYEMYSTYMFYKGRNYYAWQGNTCCDLFMQYRVAGGAWSAPIEMPGAYTQVKGFVPNRTYQIRTFYRTKTTYKDMKGATKTYWFDGRSTGAVSPAVTVSTGIGNLPIKSVKVKAYKVKKHKHKYWSSYYYGGWYTGGWVKEKYYTYKVKVTIKMKKKPGVAGIMVNGKKIKGNKKKYTVKFGTYTSLKKPKKTKFTVMAYGYKNDTYKAYSNMYKKVKKVK